MHRSTVLLATALAASACATTHQTSLTVFTAPPPTMGGATRFVLGRQLGTTPQPDRVTPTEHEPLSCVVRNGRASIEFSASTDAWPETLPEEVRCRFGRDRYIVSLDPTAPPQSSFELVDGVATLPEGAARSQPFFLPEALAFVPDIPVVASGLTDVHCRTRPTADGRYAVQIDLEPTTTAGRGTCALPTTGDGSWALTIAVVD